MTSPAPDATRGRARAPHLLSSFFVLALILPACLPEKRGDTFQENDPIEVEIKQLKQLVEDTKTERDEARRHLGEFRDESRRLQESIEQLKKEREEEKAASEKLLEEFESYRERYRSEQAAASMDQPITGSDRHCTHSWMCG